MFLDTALALEMAIKTFDQRTIKQIVDVAVPLEVAKIIRHWRDHTRTLSPDATYAAHQHG